MKKKTFFISMLLLVTVSFANAYDLATTISDNNGKILLSSVGYAKLGLIKISTSSKGVISLHGTISVSGKANVVMWAKIDGNYYFSKLPILQNLHDKKNIEFEIPFNAAEKIVSEVILEVELMGGGKIEVNNLKLING